MEVVKKSFRPEFVNRLDDIIVFDRLQKEEIKEIVKIQVNNLKNILKDKNLTFSITDKALEWLVDKGFDQEYGARPLKRAIQRYIQNPIANLILDMKDKKLDAIKIDVDDDQLILNNKILAHLPANRQSLLFSATMPEKIRALARKILKDPVEINIAISRPPEKIIQKAYVVHEPQKMPLISYLLKQTPYKNAVVFCSRKQTVKELTRNLKRSGFTVEEIHSDLEQTVRENTLSAFASGRVPLLVATDIISRGIDIDTIDLVVNWDVPDDGEDYVHRIGRTARAEADGTAYTLVSEADQTN